MSNISLEDTELKAHKKRRQHIWKMRRTMIEVETIKKDVETIKEMLWQLISNGKELN